MAEKNPQAESHQAPIDPLSYLGRDLRELSEEEVTQIIQQYETLRDTADGYVLGQSLMALRVVRKGAKDGNEGLDEMLNETDDWIFKGSKARQEQEKNK